MSRVARLARRIEEAGIPVQSTHEGDDDADGQVTVTDTLHVQVAAEFLMPYYCVITEKGGTFVTHGGDFAGNFRSLTKVVELVTELV